jgi:hypothetical protein
MAMSRVQTGVTEVIHVCIRHKRRCKITGRAADGSATRVAHLDGTTGLAKELCDSQQFTRRIETFLQRDEL